MEKTTTFYTTKDHIECPNCHHPYIYASIKRMEMVTDSKGLPVVICPACRHQVPLLKIEKHVPSVKQELMDRIQAYEKYLKGE
jgi:uncharacterized protein YbaR (Trm112 family)